ncbi:MAG: LysR family transcriptional regulator [Pseudomonadota bacterium]|uniref:LysR family transcriptional regulator n=1 Tax=Pseudohongiella sp. O18 TaxID=2904248 RepID=UPI000C94C297|nr:LysR family transcriptional regulator [Pseudohongiella sp. O18]MAY54347.1 LysR family transcriptional regulator [Gammaproteobacteria bacterium]MEC8858908.1 LysR family transcriptional regulator [Pseudomonadota bacterium]HBN15510.1 LysR family transcriptional regulator [Pseudohongiella sp.]|tara:strand:- start:332 stop:1270 length:939 start_codon:yes stop_codon:yes gene_type:complete
MLYTLNQLIQRLTFRQLQVFDAVYTKQSYSHAAVELGLTQPAVSAQIRQLEHVIGQPVFEYVGKKLYVTAAGEQLMKHVTLLFENLGRLQMELAVLQGQIRGDLRISAVSTAQYVVPYLLQGFLELYPQVDVQLQVINRAQAVERLSQNREDLFIMGMVPESRVVNLLPFLDNLLVPVVRADDPILKQRSLQTKQFLDAGLLVRERGSGTRHALEQWCSQQQLQFQPRLEMGSNDAIKHGVLAGLGVAVLPRLSISAELRLGELAIPALPGFPLRRSWSVVYPRGKHPTPVMHAFMEYVKASMPDLAKTIYG